METPNSPHPSQTLEQFYQLVHCLLDELLRGSEILLSAQKTISKEHDIGIGQCCRVARSIEAAEAPVRPLAALFAAPEQLPRPVRARRYGLLIVLENMTSLLDDVLDAVNALPLLSHRVPVQDRSPHQRQIVEQITTLIRRNQELAQAIEQLRAQIEQEEQPSMPPPPIVAHQIVAKDPKTGHKMGQWLTPYHPEPPTERQN